MKGFLGYAVGIYASIGSPLKWLNSLLAGYFIDKAINYAQASLFAFANYEKGTLGYEIGEVQYEFSKALEGLAKYFAERCQ